MDIENMKIIDCAVNETLRIGDNIKIKVISIDAGLEAIITFSVDTAYKTTLAEDENLKKMHTCDQIF